MSDKPEPIQPAPPRGAKLTPRDILERLVRLKNIAKMMGEEIEHLTLLYVAMLQEDRQTKLTVVGGVPVSRASSEGVDVEAMIRNLETAQAQQSDLTSVDEKTLFPFSGEESVLVQWLAPEIIEGGKGLVGEGPILKQYDEDLSMADAARLALWPSGFYRNQRTKEQQLLLKTLDRSVMFYIDGLPSNNPRCWAYVSDGVTIETVTIPRAGDNLPAPASIPRLGELKRKCEEIFNVIASTVVTPEVQQALGEVLQPSVINGALPSPEGDDTLFTDHQQVEGPR